MQSHVSTGGTFVETFRTLVGFLTTVCAKVHHELSAGLERLGALRTVVFTFVGMTVEHVAVQTGAALETLATHLADKWSFFKVNPSARENI